MLRPLINVPAIGPLIYTAPLLHFYPEESPDGSQPLDTTQELLVDIEEDLITFSPPSSPTSIMRATAVAREPATSRGARGGAVVDESRLFRDPLQEYHHRPLPPTSGGSSAHDSAAPLEPPLRSLSAVVPHPLFTSNGRVVVITNLPTDATALFVLRRVRGGNVTNFCLTSFRARGATKPEVLAVITFETAAAAARYTDFFGDDEHAARVWRWTDPHAPVPDGTSETSHTAAVARYARLPRAPLTDPSALPLERAPRGPAPPTRCLVVSPLAAAQLEAAWRELAGALAARGPHARAQVEDAWLDAWARDARGVVVAGALHVRFTSARVAAEALARARAAGRPWAVAARGRAGCAADPLRFEADPCARDVATLAGEGEGEEGGGGGGYAYLEGEHLPLLGLSDAGAVSRVCRDWRALDVAAAAEGRGRPRRVALVALPGDDAALVRADGGDAGAGARARHASSNNNNSSSSSTSAGLVDPQSLDYLAGAPWSVRVQTAAFLSTAPCRSTAAAGDGDDDPSYDADDEMDAEGPVVAEEPTYPNYHRPAWGPGSGATSHYWSVSMAEYRAMSDEQWRAFGTCFYIPPEGFNTPETATARQVFTHWD